MVFRRRRFARKRPSFKRSSRYSKKKSMIRRKNRTNGIIRIVRKCPEQNVYNTATAGTAASSGAVVVIGPAFQTPAFAGSTYYNIPFSVETALSDLLNSAELTSIADKYRINWVKMKIYCTSNIASSASSAQLPSIVYTIDEDDAVVPLSTTAGLNAVREKMNCKVRNFRHGGPLSIFYRPMINMDSGNLTNVVSSAKFFNCTSPNVPHYGVKGYLQDVNLAVTPTTLTQFKFDITMSVTLKDIQ